MVWISHKNLCFGTNTSSMLISEPISIASCFLIFDQIIQTDSENQVDSIWFAGKFQKEDVCLNKAFRITAELSDLV